MSDSEQTDTEKKEEHRLGTINRWDPPEEDWAANYDWTRHGTPAAYPVPEGWVLSTVNSDGVVWCLLPDAGKGQPIWNDAVEALGNPLSVEPDAYAKLRSQYPDQADNMEDDPYYELVIDEKIDEEIAQYPDQADNMEDDTYYGLVIDEKIDEKIDEEIVLVLEEGEGRWHAIAAALSRYANGGDYLSVLEDLGLEHLKATPFAESTDEQNSETNETLGGMTGESEDSENTMNLPDYKGEFARKCFEADDIVTEIDEREDVHEYHAGVADIDGMVWMATIEVNPDVGFVEGPPGPHVIFRSCMPGAPAESLYSWSRVRTHGKTHVNICRWLFVVFEAANELLETHGEFDGNATASQMFGQQ